MGEKEGCTNRRWAGELVGVQLLDGPDQGDVDPFHPVEARLLCSHMCMDRQASQFRVQETPHGKSNGIPPPTHRNRRIRGSRGGSAASATGLALLPLLLVRLLGRLHHPYAAASCDRCCRAHELQEHKE